MKTLTKNRIAALSLIVACFAVLIFLFCGGVSEVHAAASPSGYSNVLDDLSQDLEFSVESYPDKEGDYSLDVIQIAESKNGKLFVYVYNPSAKTKDLQAKKISLSTEIELAPKWKLYDLELLSSSGTLSKYLVKDFAVKDELVRIYDITEIFREWLGSDTDKTINDGTINYTACRVAKRFRAIALNDEVRYTCEATEVIEITGQYAGFLRYRSGIFSSYDCDAHFIAFSTDRKIDRLMQADLVWKSQTYVFNSSYMFDFWKVITGRGDEQTTVTQEYGKIESVAETISANEQGTFKGNGWFAKTYTWDRIQSVEKFKESEKSTDGATNVIDGFQWVIRFTETPYTAVTSSSPTGQSAYDYCSGTKISEIGILRLMFMTDGIVYNLGVVGDLVTGDDIPDNKFDPGISILPEDGSCSGFSFKSLFTLIAVVVLVIVLFPILVPLLGWLIKGIIWLITAPFKAIGKMIKNKKEKQ